LPVVNHLFGREAGAQPCGESLQHLADLVDVVNFARRDCGNYDSAPGTLLSQPV
jgi:hypothetical protein